jgi:tungstate transport system ATP-binding protein
MNLLVSNIAKRYGGKTILTDCSYSFSNAGTYVLMGPNGSGKSTFLRICSLLELPDTGELLFTDNGKEQPQDIDLRRRITLVLPKTGVFNTTVFNNVAYGPLVRGMRKNAVREKVRGALDFVGMGHKEKQNARTLSSGESQRLGLARALAIDPKILFLDEPTASVDEENTAIIESIIHNLKKDGQTMVIMTTHDKDQAGRLADTLLFIAEYKITEREQ